MKKLTSLLFLSLLASSALAQQSDDQSDPKHKKGKGQQAEQKGKPAAARPSAQPKAEGQRSAPAPSPEKRNSRRPAAAPAAKKPEQRQEAPRPPAERTAPRPEGKKQSGQGKRQAAPANAPANRTPQAKQERPQTNPDAGNRDAKNRANKKNQRPAAPAAPNAPAQPAAQPRDQSKKTNQRRQDSRPDAPRDARPNNQPNQPRVRKTEARRPAPEKIQEIRTRHENFRAEARPDRVPTVTYSESRRIENSDRWQEPQYEAFRSYRAERHDEQYYHSRYDRVELIGGGYYYLSNNYWYPAWGYRPQSEYYAYDGPVYASRRAVPPDRITADVQDSLQNLGYYQGEVDGLLGPLTRAALTRYQDDEGLEITAAIDEPTIDQLGLN